MVGERVEGVEECVDAGALAPGKRVAGRPDHLVADRLDAVIEERAAGGLAPREVVQGRARPAVSAEGEDDAVLAALAPQQRPLELPLIIGKPLLRGVLGGAQVARDGRVELGWDVQNERSGQRRTGLRTWQSGAGCSEWPSALVCEISAHGRPRDACCGPSEDRAATQ